MNAGDRMAVNWTQQRTGGAPTIEIWEHDVILYDDKLFSYQLTPDAELVHCPLIQTNDNEGSSYILYVTATKNRSTREILRAARREQMARLMATS
jgi:hypothetical protein